MLRGFLAKSWADALKDSGIKSKVERAMNKLYQDHTSTYSVGLDSNPMEMD